MKKHLFIKLSLLLFLVIWNTHAWGQTYKPARVDERKAMPVVTMQGAGMQSQQMMSGGAYNGTVYEPFSNATPSEQGGVGSSQASAKAPNGPRKAFDTTADYGGSGESPVGEPWILILFALGFMGIIFIRKRKLSQTTKMKNTNKFIATLALLFTLGVGQMWAGTYTIYVSGNIFGDAWDNSTSKIKIGFNYNPNNQWCSHYDMTPIEGKTYKGKKVYSAEITSSDNNAKIFFQHYKNNVYQSEVQASSGDNWTSLSTASGKLYEGWNGSSHVWSSFSYDKYVTGGYVYFDNSSNLLSNNYRYFVIGRSGYSKVYSLTRLSDVNTNIWYADLTNESWDDASYCAFVSPTSEWGSGSWGSENITNANKRTGTMAINYSDQINSGKYYLYTPASGSNDADISRSIYTGVTGLNRTQSFVVYKSTNRGSSYSSDASWTGGVIKADRYYMNSSATSADHATGGSKTTLNSSNTSTDVVLTSSVTFSGVANTGYSFVGFSNSTTAPDPENTNDLTYTVSGANTKYAFFKRNHYAISYSPSPASHFTYTTAPTDADYGTTVNMTITPDDGYTVASVTAVDASSNSITVTPGSSNGYSFTMPASAVTVTVTMAVTTVRVTFDATTNGGTCATAYHDDTYGERYNYGSHFFPTAVKNGYHFRGWYTEAEGGTRVWDSDIVTDLDGAITLYAHYDTPIIEYVSCSPYSVVPGDEVSINVTYQVGTAPEGSYQMCYQLSTGTGDVIADQPTFTASPSSTTATFIAPKTTGWYAVDAYLFAGSSDCSSLADPVASKVATTTMFWIVAANKVTVKYQCNGVDLLPSTVVQVPDVLSKAVSVTAPEIDGLTFSGWSHDSHITARNETDDSSNPISITADAATTLTATYNQSGYVYFKNIHNWENVYFYRYHDRSYWGDSNTGNYGMGHHGNTDSWTHYCVEGPVTMQKVAGSDDVYYCKPSSTPTTGQGYAFTDQPSKEDFFGHDGAYDHINVLKCYGQDFYNVNHMIVPDPDETGTNPGGNYDGKVTYYSKYCEAPSLASWNWYMAGDWNWSEHFTLKGEKLGAMTFQTSRYFDAAGATRYICLFNPSATNYGCYARQIYQSDNITDITSGKNMNMGLNTNAPGEYIFTVTYSHNNQSGGFPGKIELVVTYPVQVGDYRLFYTTDKHPGNVIASRENGEDLSDMFVASGNADKVKIQTCTAVGNTNVTWGTPATATYADGVDFATLLASKDGGPGVYTFTIAQDASGLNPTVTNVEKYTGQFYVRTDSVENQWSYWLSKDAHMMTYSEYSTTLSTKPYSHYYVKDIHGSTSSQGNIKFTVATDNSLAITDTVVNGDATGDYIDYYGSANLKVVENVRFTYNQKTNKIWRAYTEGPANNNYMVLRSNGTNVWTDNGSGSKGSLSSAIKFADQGNWVYQVDAWATPGAYVKLTAEIHNKDATGNDDTTPAHLTTQYLKGKNNDTWDADNAVLIIGGESGDAQHMRITYDFKTDRMMTAWLPGGTVSDRLAINADVMLIRVHQEAGQSITFGDSGDPEDPYSLSGVKTVYGVMQFNKSTINDRRLSQFERDLFWISFPFDVNLSDVFGFGTYMQHWAIQYYDGKGRAKNGYWYDSPSNWKFVTSAMRETFVLKANEGYILALDLEELDDYSSVWDNVSSIYLYFPSTTNLGTILEKDSKTVNIDQDGYQCTIDRRTDKTRPNTDKDRRVADSYWHCIGVPSFAGAEHAYAASYTSGIPTVDPDNEEASWSTKNLPFIYRWDMTYNELFPVKTGTVTFEAMHSYLVQYSQPTITWANVVVSQPAAIKARLTQQTDYNLSLVLTRGEAQQDQTFIRLSDDENVTDNFEFNQDLSKENNRNKANIWTLTADQYPVAGNSMPFSAETKTIQVGVKIASDGEYTFSMPEGTDGVGVILVDNIAGTRTSLSLTDYTVNLTAGTYDGRFLMEISPIAQAPTDIETISDERLEISGVRKVMVDGVLYIVKDGKVFDARGNRVQ